MALTTTALADADCGAEPNPRTGRGHAQGREVARCDAGTCALLANVSDAFAPDGCGGAAGQSYSAQVAAQLREHAAIAIPGAAALRACGGVGRWGLGWSLRAQHNLARPHRRPARGEGELVKAASTTSGGRVSDERGGKRPRRRRQAGAPATTSPEG